MRFSIYQESKRGGRKVNQDRMGYAYTKGALVMVLCDGMGGHLYGEVAAQIALETIGQMFQQQAKPSLPDPRQFLEDSMMAAHIEIHRYRAGRGLPESPRTTCVTAVFQDNQAWWAHAGDSRLYWLRDGKILQITRDHSQLEAMIADGLIDKNDPLEDMPDRNRLFNCLGAPAMPMIELADPVKIRSGDHFLLCSDGLWGALDDNTIAHSFRNTNIMRVVPELINHALLKAGSSSDNVTAIGMTWADSQISVETSGLAGKKMEEEFTSTIKPKKSLESEPIGEDAIESAIAEIRQAIAKTQQTPAGKKH